MAIETRAPRRSSRWLVAAVFLLGCRSGGTSPEPGAVLLRLSVPPDAATPDELRVSVFDDLGPLWRDVRVPGEGALRVESAERLGTVLIQPGEVTGGLRLHVRALAAGARVADGVLTVAAGDRGTFDLPLDPGPVPDGDADGVPDPIDDCPDRANANQGGCPGDDLDGGTDGVPGTDGGAPPPDASEERPACPLAEGCDKPLGATCTNPAACASGFCADGVCCSNACDGVCRSCNQPGADGICRGYAAATDPEGECSGGATCNGAGACGTPPPPASKRNGELCAGAGECLSGFCVDGACCNSACNAACNSCASGTCTPITRGDDAPECTAPLHCNTRARCVGD